VRGLSYNKVLELIVTESDIVVLDLQDSTVDIANLNQQARLSTATDNADASTDALTTPRPVHVPAGYCQYRQISLTRDGQLGLNIVTEEVYPRILSILPGSLAAATGQFQEDDYILQVRYEAFCSREVG